MKKMARTSGSIGTLSLRAKILSFLAALCLLCAADHAAFARPAGTGVYTVRQSDGSSFQVVQRGDEYGHWTEARDTGAVVVRGRTGSWCFARETGTGLLASTGRRYSKTAAAAGAFLKNYAPAVTNTVSANHRWTPVSVSGDKKLLILRVTFPEDASLDETMSVSLDYHLDNIWNGELSVRQYFRDQSKGKLDVEPCDADSKIIEVPMTSADYNEGRHPNRLISNEDKDQYANEVAFVQAVLKKAQQLGGLQYGDYAKWDDKLQKYVITPNELVVYLLVAGFEEAISAPDARPAVWAHALYSDYDDGADYQVWVSGDVDGQSEDITLEKWAMNGELVGSLENSVPMPATGTMCHELGHEICGLPDLYDTSYYNGGLGFFSLMSYGLDGAAKDEASGTRPVNLDAWSRYYLGWTAPTALAKASGSVTVAAQDKGAPVMLKGPASLPYQYLLLETRDTSDRWDKGLNYSGISKPGVLIEHVDETVGSGSLALGNDINCHSSVKHQGVMPVYPYEDTRLQNAGSSRQQSLWYQGNPSADVAAGIGAAASADYLKTRFFAAADSVSADVSTDIAVRNFSAYSAATGSITVDFSNTGPASGDSSADSRDRSSGGGCSAGFAALALLAFAPVWFKSRR